MYKNGDTFFLSLKKINPDNVKRMYDKSVIKLGLAA